MSDPSDIEDLEADLEDSSPAKQKRLNPAEWEEVKLLWERGEHTLADLSKEYGIRPDTIQRRLKEDNVQKGARAHEVASGVATAVHDEMAKQAAATKDANLAALNKAAKTLEVLRKERWVILGLDREDGDPEDMDELMITELSQEQIEAMQAEMRGLEYSDPMDGFSDDNDIVDEEDED